MISFDFTPDQTAFQKTLVDFSRKVLLPGYRDRAASTEFPFEILRQLGELGVLGIGLPEKYGGTGAEDPVTLGLATETLAYGAAASPGIGGQHKQIRRSQLASEVFAATVYGQAGASATGTLTLPTAANVRLTVGPFGVGGTSSTPSLASCAAA